MIRAQAWLSGVAFVAVAMLSAGCSQESAPANVDQARLTNAAREPANWMTYGGIFDEQRFSTLEQIDDKSISDLKLAWYFDLDTNRGQEATPLVIDGVMYTTTAWSKVFALDAKSGALLWKYDPQVPGGTGVHACCDVVNRGVAAWKGKIFVASLDGRLIALDAKIGTPKWTVDTIVDHSMPYTITGAPRAFKDKVIIGNGGSELGVRGYVSVYNAETGDLVWRFFTVPGDPAKGPDGAASDDVIKDLTGKTWFGNWWKYGGGGTVWDSIVYDPELNQLYLGVGNGAPWNHKIRSGGKGDNLFLSSIVAVDPDTGKYLWHYQANPGESWDFTNTQQITLATLTIDGAPRKVLMQAPKNGFFYVIDRANGKLISAKNFVPVNWATGIDMKTGRPIEATNARYDKGSFIAEPSAPGAHNWQPMSFSPKTGLVYIPAQIAAISYSDRKDFVFQQGRWNTGVSFLDPPPIPGVPDDPAAIRAALLARIRGELLAWDPVAQREVWRVEHPAPGNGGTLATSGNLVFQGTATRAFQAFRADTGEKLWSFDPQGGIIAAPMTYSVDGEQFVAVMVGLGGSAWLAAPSDEPAHVTANGRVLAFNLAGAASLPPYEPKPLSPPNPPSESFTAEQVALGEHRYTDFCAICHDGSVLPDLRRASALSSKEAWAVIVIGGARESGGMASFKDYLSPDEAEAIRAYVAGKARELQEEESKVSDGSPG